MKLGTFKRPLKQVYVSYFNEEGKKVDDGFEDYEAGDTITVESTDGEEDPGNVFIRVVPDSKEGLPEGFYKALNEVPRDAIDIN